MDSNYGNLYRYKVSVKLKKIASEDTNGWLGDGSYVDYDVILCCEGYTNFKVGNASSNKSLVVGKTGGRIRDTAKWTHSLYLDKDAIEEYFEAPGSMQHIASHRFAMRGLDGKSPKHSVSAELDYLVGEILEQKNKEWKQNGLH